MTARVPVGESILSAGWGRLANVLLLGAGLFLAGCAYRPGLLPPAPGEAAAGRAAFLALADGQGICARAVDAEATVTLDVPWQSGTIGGYLQLMAPGFVKFVGVNPLGQPMLVLATDGADCRYVLPSSRALYDGKIAEAEVSKHLPAGFDPTRSYYWLTGRLRPGRVLVGEVGGDPGGAGLWVKFRYEGETRSELALIDPRSPRLLRHQLLDETDGVILDVSYDLYAAGDCPLPGLVIIQGDNRLGRLVLRLGNWLPADTLAAGDFTVTAPSDYVRMKIK